MAEAPLITIPSFRGTVEQRFALEPLGGPKDVFYYLDRFPEEIYQKSPDSHLYKFMRSMLGESGVNWIKKNYLEARLLLEEVGIELFDLDKFYGNPFQFGRIVEEAFDDDPYGLIPKDKWEQIKAKNARYRNRALDFINGARAGNTPYGMRLVARSGLAHDVEIIENYKYLYDVHSDDPLGLDYYGKSVSTEEMIVLPRREVGQSESQMITIRGEPEPPDLGSFSIIYNGRNSADYLYTYDDGSGPVVMNRVPYNGTRDHVRLALESLPDVEPGDIYVEGGPGPNNPFIIKFQGRLANRDVPQVSIDHNMVRMGDSNNPITVDVVTLTGGQESVEETVQIPARNQYHLQQAVDRVRPQTTIMTLGEARGSRARNNWTYATASSEYNEVLRYVTGNPTVRWPAQTSDKPNYWIEPQVEKEAPRIRNDLQHHYTGFHTITNIEASSEFLTVDGPLGADRAAADYFEPLHVTSATELRNESAASFINGVYPVEYKDLQGVPPIRYKTEQYWSSLARAGTETLSLNFQFIKAVNYVSFDLLKCPVQIDIEYDAYDDEDQLFVPITPTHSYNNIITESAASGENPWISLGFTFWNRKQELIYTRSLKLTFTRLGTYADSIRVKNLRVARNV